MCQIRRDLVRREGAEIRRAARRGHAHGLQGLVVGAGAELAEVGFEDYLHEGVEAAIHRACEISGQKQVHAVGLPVFLYRMMLQWGARKQVQTFRQQSDWRTAQQEASEQADSAPVSRGTQLADSAMVQKSEEILGNFMGQPIHAWIMSNGQRLVYERAVPPGGSFQLAEQEVLFENRLIYRPA